MAEKNAMLVMRDVSKTFNPGTVNEKCALKNLNLTLKQGDFATIVGSNGAGKSTLFNAITGAFFADKGLIMLDGEDITYQKEHVRSKVIGHLFQDPLKGTAPHMTIEEPDQGSGQEKIQRAARTARHGVRRPYEAAGRTFVRWTASGTHTFDGNDGDS